MTINQSDRSYLPLIFRTRSLAVADKNRAREHGFHFFYRRRNTTAHNAGWGANDETSGKYIILETYREILQEKWSEELSRNKFNY